MNKKIWQCCGLMLVVVVVIVMWGWDRAGTPTGLASTTNVPAKKDTDLSPESLENSGSHSRMTWWDAATTPLDRWRKEEIISQDLLMTIGDDVVARHRFFEDGKLEVYLENSGEEFGVTSWTWTMDEEGVVHTSCEELKMTCQMKLLFRSKEGFDVISRGKTESEELEPIMISLIRQPNEH